MLIPTKEMSEQEVERWEVALSTDAFENRTAKANHRAASTLNRTFKSTAKKWRDYYGHDSGHSRIVVFDDEYPPGMGNQRRGTKDTGKAFMEAQVLPVNTLISRSACQHEHQTTETVHEKGRWTDRTVTVRSCPRCGQEERTEIAREKVSP